MKEYEKRKAFVEAAREINEDPAGYSGRAIVRDNLAGRPVLRLKDGVGLPAEELIKKGARIRPASGRNPYVELY